MLNRRGFLGGALAGLIGLTVPMLPKSKVEKKDEFGYTEADRHAMAESLTVPTEKGPYSKLMKGVMRRNGFNKNKDSFDYDDLYISPEAMEDIRNWGVDEIDETTKKEIMNNFSPPLWNIKEGRDCLATYAGTSMVAPYACAALATNNTVEFGTGAKKLQEILDENEGNGSLDIIWGPDIELQKIEVPTFDIKDDVDLSCLSGAGDKMRSILAKQSGPSENKDA